MTTQPERDFSRRPLRPPSCRSAVSYTKAPRARGDITVRNNTKKTIEVIEFSSQATPQPFLDPSVIQRRIQTDELWRVEQERVAKPGGISSSTSHAV